MTSSLLTLFIITGMSKTLIITMALLSSLFLLAFTNTANTNTDMLNKPIFATTDTNPAFYDNKYNNDTTAMPNSSLNLSAIGTIDSLIITVPPSGFNITDAFKVVLTGGWTLSVYKGNVTYFDASFLASPMDGTKHHIHQMTNFKADDNIKGKINNGNDESYRKNSVNPETLDNHTSLSANGTMDVKINGIDVWKNVNASISISKGNVVAINLNDMQTAGHFGKQQVYGIVSRLII